MVQQSANAKATACLQGFFCTDELLALCVDVNVYLKLVTYHVDRKRAGDKQGLTRTTYVKHKRVDKNWESKERKS